MVFMRVEEKCPVEYLITCSKLNCDEDNNWNKDVLEYWTSNNSAGNDCVLLEALAIQCLNWMIIEGFVDFLQPFVKHLWKKSTVDTEQSVDESHVSIISVMRTK